MGAFDDLIPKGRTGSPTAKLSPQTQTELSALRKTSSAANQTAQEYDAARAAIKRLKPGPFRGRILDAAIPEQGGGFWDALGAGTLGTVMKVTGALPDQDVSDFQRLKGLQAQRVLTEQLPQKGPQTDSDAARLQLTEISPYKMEGVNNAVIESGMKKVASAKAQIPFYTQWTAKYGLNGLNEQGLDVETAYQQSRAKGGGWKLLKAE